jgi:hypothetical protein
MAKKVASLSNLMVFYVDMKGVTEMQALPHAFWHQVGSC